MFQAKDVQVIAVGVGKDINPHELEIIAMGQKEHMISISGFNYLGHALANIRDEACGHGKPLGIESLNIDTTFA